MRYTAVRPSASSASRTCLSPRRHADGPPFTEITPTNGDAVRGDSPAAFSAIFDDPENVPINSASSAVLRELAMFTSENCVQEFGVVLVLELKEEHMILKQVSENVTKYGFDPETLLEHDVSELLVGTADVEALRHAILECKSLRRSSEQGIDDIQAHETWDKARCAVEVRGGGGGTAMDFFLAHMNSLRRKWMHTRLRISRGLSRPSSSHVEKAYAREITSIALPLSPTTTTNAAASLSSAAAKAQGADSGEQGQEQQEEDEGGSTTVLATVALCNIASVFIVTLEEELPAAAPHEDFANTLLSVMQIVQGCSSPEEAAQELANACRVQSGADRVMIYRFAPVDYHGEVVAESSAETIKDSFLGMHFPAQDIPVFARLLFMRTPFRMIVDVNSESVHMCPRSTDRTSRGGILESVTTGGKGPSPLGSKLDTSECVARWANGCHLQYLANMRVRGSFTVPIIIKRKLWGLACHHHHASSLYLSITTRYQLSLLVMIVAVHIDRLNTEEKLRRIVAVQRALPDPHDIGTIAEYLRDAAPNLLQMLQCCSIAFFPPQHGSQSEKQIGNHDRGDGGEVEDVPIVHGTPVSVADVRRVVELISIQQNTATVFSTHTLATLVFPPSLLRQRHRPRKPQTDNGGGSDGIGGCGGGGGGGENEDCMLAGAAIAFSEYFTIVFLRREFIQTVRWAGRDDQSVNDGDLTPRWSFSVLTRQTLGESLQWSEEDIQFVGRLRAKLVAGAERRELDKQRAVSMSLSVARDVALHAAAQKSNFLARMSHELRTPFNGMIGFLQLLLQTDQTEAQREYASTAYECAANMLDILDDVLLVSKLENGKMDLLSVPTDIISLVSKVQALMMERARQLEAIMTFVAERCSSAVPDGDVHSDGISPGGKLPTACAEPLRSLSVLVDPGRLRQVMLNLISNAIKFTGQGGRITVTLLAARDSNVFAAGVEEEAARYVASSVPRNELKAVVNSLRVVSCEPSGHADRCDGISGTSGDGNKGSGSENGEPLFQPEGTTPAGSELPSYYVKISVADTGMGIAAGQVPLLFMPFTQLEDGPSRRYEGTGLGLALCKELVHLMGGRVILCSTMGEGSSFMLLLRLMDAQTAAVTALPLSSSPPAPHHGHSSRSSTMDDDREFQTSTLASLLAFRAASAEGEEERLGRVSSEVRGTALSSCHSMGSTPDRGRGKSAGSEGTRDSEIREREEAPLASDMPTDTGEEDAATRAVMVVDDNKVNQRMLVKMLGCIGRPDLRIEVANDGREALAMAQQLHSHLDCIFMDLHMPGMDGLESCQRIRAWERENGLPACEIVGLTADVVGESHQKGLASGMDCCLSKPMDLSFLKNFMHRKAV